MRFLIDIATPTNNIKIRNLKKFIYWEKNLFIVKNEHIKRNHPYGFINSNA